MQLTELFEECQQTLDERSSQLRETTECLTSTRLTLTETRQDLAITTRQKEEEKYLVEEHVKAEGVLLAEAEQVWMDE